MALWSMEAFRYIFVHMKVLTSVLILSGPDIAVRDDSIHCAYGSGSLVQGLHNRLTHCNLRQKPLHFAGAGGGAAEVPKERLPAAVVCRRHI